MRRVVSALPSPFGCQILFRECRVRWWAVALGSMFRGLVRVRVRGWFVCGFGVRYVLLPAFGGDEPFRFGVGAFHVDDPFAAPSGVFRAQAAVGVELAFEVGIDAAFEPVGVVGRAVLLEVGEEHAVALHRDDAEVGTAQPFMGPPPCASRLGLGVVGIGPGVRAFLDVAAVARVPVVEPRHPCGGLLGPVDAGQFPDVSERFAAGLAPGVARQIGERVA